MIKKSLPIGIENFEEVITENCYYVDKTDVIESLIINKSKVKLFPRPRRFGKSLLLSTIDCFFNKEKEKTAKMLFKGLSIEKSKVAKQEKSKYPVVMINLKGIKANNWEETFETVQKRMSEVYKKFIIVKEVLDEDELEEYIKIEKETANISEYKLALKKLTIYLERLYKQKTIVLIDEYDTPIDNSFNKGFYTEAIVFFRGMYTEVLKGNDSLKFCCLTGVVRISSESMFSDLNHLTVYGILDNPFSEYFGFTEPEVIKMLKYYGLEKNMEEVKQWYNGYKFGETKVYNPWSILNYIDKQKIESYWVNTGENTVTKQIVSGTSISIKPELIKLINGEIVTTQIEEKISYKDLSNTDVNALTMLLFSGYLTVVRDFMLEDEKYCELKIPNTEIRGELKKIVRNWVTSLEVNPYLELFKTSVLEGNLENMQISLNDILIRTVSYIENIENFYHGFVLGLLVGLGDRYIVKSNREVGLGRFDVSIEAKDKSIGVIFEFKIAKKQEDLDGKLKEAVEQIEKKKYYLDFEERGIEKIYKYGAAFCEKQVNIIER